MVVTEVALDYIIVMKLEQLLVILDMVTNLANLNVINWYGVFVPQQTPREVVDTLEREMLTLPKNPDFVKKMKDLSFDPVVLGSREFTRMIHDERRQWKEVIKAAGIDAKAN